ncbi:hypothetical protein KEG38_27470 [Polyangium jinanense]|uniref:hypothetical protein n=1 Tax=Polyangium jinanense TaxID=2829994 RepID=UPI0023414E8D|nr:hypothetical protein [Polyangium jinanense]MDC3957629.1 hypothetical protein [Polyangium jinanense]
MREDILEQLVDDHLQLQGYFTRHNLKFKPRSDHLAFSKRHDSNHSDIDVVGFHPTRLGDDRVVAVSCKSWQSGFDVRSKLEEVTQNKRRGGRESWKYFRELVEPKWSEAFVDAVEAMTGTRKFTYVLAVTAIRGDRSLWENHAPFRQAIEGNSIRVLALNDMIDGVCSNLTTTVVPSQLGRTLQLLKAAGLIGKVDPSSIGGAAQQAVAAGGGHRSPSARSGARS